MTPHQKLGQRPRHNGGDRAAGLRRPLAHPSHQHRGQSHREHCRLLGHGHPPPRRGVLHIPARLPHRTVELSRQRPCGSGRRYPRLQQLDSRVDPPGVFPSASTSATIRHAIRILLDTSLSFCDTPRTFQPSVTQRHLKLEVAKCVGGVVSPLLLNIALHGMETAAGVRYYVTGTRAGKTKPHCPAVIRYADDMIALCHSREQAEQVKAKLAEWLEPRGLVFNEDKTQIAHLDQGVDFLGFSIRRYPNGKLLTKPSSNALRRIQQRLSIEMRTLRGANADAVIAKLNPIITGWTAYYRIGVSKRAFGALDAHLWRLAYKWAKFSHPNKPRHWVTTRYFGMFNPARRDAWIFGSRDSGFYLRKFAWTPIVRHRMVAGTASPDDPSLTDYWARRRRRNQPPMGTTTLRLLQVQQGRCTLCRGLLLHADHQPQSPHEWEQWLVTTRIAIRKRAIAVWAAGTPDERVANRLIHAHCQRRFSAAVGPVSPTRGPSELA
jgi:RNA-directed DNA polymerase